jgi:tetratricopeptide (TPR) repeat protein
MLIVFLAFGQCARVAAGPVVFPEFTASSAQSYLRTQASEFQSEAGAGAETYFLLARLQNRMGHQDDAERLARQALACDPKRADIHSFLGKLFLGQGRFEEAANSFRKSLELDPKAAGDYRRLGMVLDQLGDYEGARNAFSTGIGLAPADAAAQLMLGRLLLDHGDIHEAITHLEAACQLDPASENAFYVLSQAQAKIGDQTAARETLKTFQRLRETAKQALAAQDAGYDNEAEMRQVAAGFHMDAAAFFFRRGRQDLTQAHLKQAALVAPKDLEVYETLAAFSLNTGDLPAAREAYENLTRLRPAHAIYRVRLGILLARLKDNPAAVVELKRALELDPNQLDALNSLARIYLHTHQELPDALALCRRSVSLQPDAANYDLLAQACFVTGQIEEARAASAHAVELDPGNAVYREHHQRFNQTQ